MNIKKHLSFSSLCLSLSSVFRSFPDHRQKGKVKNSVHDATMTAFACMHFQDKSFLQFEKRVDAALHPENLKNLFDIQTIPEATQIRSVLDGLDSNEFSPIFKEVFSRLQRGKHLEQYQVLPGLYTALSSKKISCSKCLTCEHKNGEFTCSHKVLQAAIMHPKMSQLE